MSGTVAGAIQGMALGVPSIALSQSLAVFHDDDLARYDTAETYAPGIIQRLLDAGWPDDVLININFPNREPQDVESVEVTRQGRRDMHNMKAEKRTDLRGRDYYWMGFTARRPVVVRLATLSDRTSTPIRVTPSLRGRPPRSRVFWQSGQSSLRVSASCIAAPSLLS
jgi:5'-nucleotidase